MEARLYPTPGNPPPEHVSCGFFTGVGGVQLRYGIFRTGPHVAAKGTVVLVHGRNECLEKYFETIRDLNAMGLWVASYDHRGQGASGRLLPDQRRGHVRRFADYEKDLQTFLTEIVLPDTRLPFFLIAHSTGALIALSAAPNLASRIERMALTAPFLGLSGQGLPSSLVKMVAGTACWLGLGSKPLTRERPPAPFDTNLVTTDQRRYERNTGIYKAHPELSLGPPSARWLAESFRTMDRVNRQEHLTKIIVPTLVIAPTGDRLVPYERQEALARKFRACQLVPVAGSGHEVFQERDRFRAQALAAIAAFMPGGDPDDFSIGDGY